MQMIHTHSLEAKTSKMVILILRASTAMQTAEKTFCTTVWTAAVYRVINFPT